MSSEPAIRLRGVSKGFNIYANPADRLKQMLWRGQRRFYNLFQALYPIDLEVSRGETVGIIGRNGSGKSTLLQIIAGTLAPSEGTVEVNGRVAALLELGTGFNPEFTGRENVFLNAAILGLSQSEIERKFDTVAAFADIGEFLDRPVKTYSSGMYTRLAFAVAINVDPDILIVDEALAVGDEAFQRKCFARIHAIRDSGASILFVSHSVGTILELCDRVVLLERGQRIYTGAPKRAVALYQKLTYAPPQEYEAAKEYAKAFDGESIEEANAPAEATPVGAHPSAAPAPSAPSEPSEASAKLPTAPVDDGLPIFDPGLVSQSVVAYSEQGAKISGVIFKDGQSRVVNILRRGVTYYAEYSVAFSASFTNVYFSMLVKTVSGLELGAQRTRPFGDVGITVRPGETYSVRLPFVLPFTEGVYFANAGVVGTDDRGETYVLHRLIDALMFRIPSVPGDRTERHVSILAREQPVVLREAANVEDRPMEIVAA